MVFNVIAVAIQLLHIDIDRPRRSRSEENSLFNLITGLLAGVSALVFQFMYLPYGQIKDDDLRLYNSFFATDTYDPHYAFEAKVLSWFFGVMAAVLLICAFGELVRYMWRRMH